MMVNVYSIYDRKTEVYHQPTFVHNTGSAFRYFMQLFSNANSKTIYYDYAEDYEVWHIGTFDPTTGKLEKKGPTLLCKGTEIVSEIQKKFGGPNEQ